MTATRHPDDFYSTPPYVTRAILPYLPRAGHVLDPCAGTGAILSELVTEGVDPRNLYAIELNEARAAECRSKFVRGCDVVDSLISDWRPRPDLVITNPPFKLATEFVRKALEESASGATVAMLLRLSFMESMERHGLHVEHPSDVFVFSRRPVFRTDGGKKTDTTTVAWFVWGPGRGGRWTVLGDKAVV